MEKNANQLNRREFIRTTTTCALGTIIAASMVNPLVVQAVTSEIDDDKKEKLKQLKKDFFQYACSGALFLYLNREFGHPKENEALPVASLSGGIMQCGHQCGMLWGSALASGAEAFRRFENQGLAINKAISATQNLTKSFLRKAKSMNCQEITNTDWSRKFSIFKYLVTGKTITCLHIAKKWAPKAVKSAEDGLSEKEESRPETPLSCATEVAKKMGAGKEKEIMVAGLAGGYGLSGYGCGALAAAVWIKSLQWFDENEGSTNTKDIYNAYAQKTLDAFNNTTNAEMRCEKICGRNFNSVKEHTEYIKNGGCSNLINTLANS